jgi:hypothetical protein|tara:strand:- start:145 stop:996 length:852 start_codon:yes stop_codon:yes gene_type:complete
MSDEDIHISFITSIKLCGGYIDFKYRIKLYIEQISKNCKKLGIPFEILICEDMCEKNAEFLKDFFSDEFLIEHNTRLFERKQDYPNPREHNMLESYNKNLCIGESKGKYICSTSGDVFMNDDFFKILPGINDNSFHRFLSFEVKELDKLWKDCDLGYMSHYCENNTIRCYNNSLRCNPETMTKSDVAYKSGDIMLMSRAWWIKIRGFPQNGCFHHTDYVVCSVVNNNKIKLVTHFEPIKIYSLQHSRYSHIVDKNKKIKLSASEMDQTELKICRELRNSLTCN